MTITLGIIIGLTILGPDRRSVARDMVPPRTITVTVFVADALDRPDMAALVRRVPGAQPQYFVGIRRDFVGIRRGQLGPELLSAALNAISSGQMNRAKANQQRIDLYFRANARLRPIGESERTSLTTLIQRLLTAPARRIPQTGTAQAVDVDIADGAST